MSNTSKLYETDYGAWAKRQVELLGSRRFADLDIAHLVDELTPCTFTFESRA